MIRPCLLNVTYLYLSNVYSDTWRQYKGCHTAVPGRTGGTQERWPLFVCWWNVHTGPDKTESRMEKSLTGIWAKQIWNAKTQFLCGPAKLIVERSNANRGKELQSWVRDMVRTWPGCAQVQPCPSHLLGKAGPQLSSVFVRLQFSGKSGGNCWEETRTLFFFTFYISQLWVILGSS